MEDNSFINEENNNTNKIDEPKTDSYKGFGKGVILGIIVGILLVFFIYGCIMIVQMVSKYTSKDNNSIDKETFKKIQNIEKIIDSNFYKYNDEVTTENLEEGIFQGMMDSLNDHYAEYYSAEEMQAVMDDVEGIKYGIGCYVTMEDDMPLIYGVMEDSPAEKAGVLNGDIIVSVDGESVAGKTLTEVVEMIKGLEGTEVSVTFNRDGELIQMTIVRGAVIENTTVNFGVLTDNEEIGYIRIKDFEDVTIGQYQEAFKELYETEKIKGLILDLRNNPGGNLNAVVDIARQILPEGLIVYTEDNKGVRKEYTCDGENQIKIPLVVLINAYSASASEILSGAIQDHNVGTLVGTTSYGKGIVQSILNVGDGSMVKLTTSAYFTPSGKNIQGVGITPDIVLEFDSDKAAKDGSDNQVEKALQILEDKIGD